MPEEVLTPVETPVVTPSWRDALPDDLKADKSLETFKDVPSLAKSYVETKKLVGTKSAPVVPGDKAAPEELAAWRKALGVPETPEGYTPKAHPLMAHPEWNKEAQGAFLKLAHEEHVTPKALDRILSFYGDLMASTLKNTDDVAVQAKGELRSEWGVNYDTYLGAANNGMTRVAQALGVAAKDVFEATKGSDPVVVAKMFHWMESQFTEHGWVSGEQVRGVTPEMAIGQIGELQAALAKVPEGSPQALEIIDRIAHVGRALKAA